MSDPTLPPVRMRYSLESRCRVVQAVLDGATPEETALAQGAGRSSGYRWWGRYRAAGGASLRDRPCTPHRQPRRLSREAETEIIAVRERSGGGPEVVGAIVDRPASTVGKMLRRLGRSRLPKPPRPPGGALRARASGGAAAHRHQEARPLLARGQVHPA